MTPRFEREGRTPEPCISVETVTLRSPSGEEFVVLARPLAHLSKYFRTALNSSFQEATTRVFDLVEHCDDKILQAFTNWVYLRSSGAPYSPLSVPFMSRLSLRTVVKAWLFGDYIRAPAFQNDMMVLILDVGNEQFNECVFKSVGQSVPENSPLERFLVDRLCSLIFYHGRSHIDMVMDWCTANLTSHVCKKLCTAIWDKGAGVGKKNYAWVGKYEEYTVEEEKKPEEW
ncbi:hypothetical protein F4823DRAFT_640722 [Ustulina deusta]|nr:hypothetical protein F4823DRAFT_640722 [Ustulina deusta]